MCLHNNGIAGGQRRSRVAARRGKSDRKIADAERHDGSQRPEHAADVGFGNWLSIWIGMIDPCVNPGALFDQIRKHPQLAKCASGLATDTTLGQSRLQGCAQGQFVRDRLNVVCHLAQKCRPILAAQRAVGAGRFRSQTNGIL